MKEFFRKQYEAIKHSNRWVRMTLGVLLVVLGLAGAFLPLLGVWIAPLGLALLAIDFPAVRRFNQKLMAWVQKVRERLSAWWRGQKAR